MQEDKTNGATTSKAFDISASSIPKLTDNPKALVKTKDSNMEDISPISMQRHLDSLSITKMGGTVQAPAAILQSDIPGISAISSDHPPIQPAAKTSIQRSKIQKHKQLFQLMNRSVNECKYCHYPLNDLRKVIHEGVYRKYESSTQRTYNTNIINDVIFNANTHIVSVFKDYLIYDDLTEFLKRYYSNKETNERLHKLCTFYDKYSKVFPNYISLEEKKYMFKNIERKQKMIDEKHDALQKANHENSGKDLNGNIFTKKFVEQLSTNHSKVRLTKNLDLGELVDKFIDCDTMDGINSTNCDAIEASFVETKASARKLKVDTRTVLTKAEYARKKSVEAQHVVASTKAKQTIEPLSHRMLGSVRHTNVPITIPSSGLTPVSVVPTSLAKFKIRKPEAQKGVLVQSGRFSAGSYRDISKNYPSKVEAISNNSRKSSHRDPLNININLNVILNKEKSRTDTPQSCTAAGMHRYKSLERIRVNDNRKILFAGVPTPRPLPTQNSSRGYYGSTLKSRPEEDPKLKLERVYSNPSLCIRPSAVSRQGQRRIVKRRNGSEAIGEVYKNLREIASPVSLRIAHHVKSKSSIPFQGLVAVQPQVFEPKKFVVRPGVAKVLNGNQRRMIPRNGFVGTVGSAYHKSGSVKRGIINV